MTHKGLALLPFNRQWMGERILSRLIRLSDHRQFGTMFGNTVQRPHSSSNDCTARAAPNGLRACVASIRLLSVCTRARLDAMICSRVNRHCTRMSLPFTVLQNEAARYHKARTAICLGSQLLADETQQRVRQVAHTVTMGPH